MSTSARKSRRSSNGSTSAPDTRAATSGAADTPQRAATIPQRLRGSAAAADIPEFLRLSHLGREDETFSYRQVLRRGEAWASLLRDRGLTPGDTVAIVLPHSIDAYAAFIGAMLGGFVPSQWAPASPKIAREDHARQLAALLESARPSAVVCQPGELDSSARDGDRLLLSPPDVPEAASPLPPFEPPDADATAFLQYSSGTTGLKKGVAITHRALLWQVDAYAEAIRLRDDDRIVSWLPLYHDMGLVCCMLLPILRRVRLIAMSPFDWVRRPAMWLRAMSDHGGTLSWLPNFAYVHLAQNVREDELAGVDLSLARGVVNCSEPILADSQRRFVERFGAFGLRPTALAASYALAENTFAVTSGGFDAPLVERDFDGAALAREARAIRRPSGAAGVVRLVSSGKPLPETVVEIVDSRGRRAADGQVGEIVIQSPSLMRGYAHDDAASAASLRGSSGDGARRFFTGDLGFVHEGELYVTGRKKDVIICCGINLFPHDVEAVVQAVPGVIGGRAVALGVQNAALGSEDLIVLAETRECDPSRRDEIERLIRERVLAAVQVSPADVRLVPHMWLKKSTSGKIARSAIRDRYLAERAKPSSMDDAKPRARRAPASAAAALGDQGDPQLLAAVMSAVQAALRRRRGALSPSLSPDEPLLTSGRLDSLGLVDVVVAAERLAGRALPDDVLADASNLDSARAIAAAIERVRCSASAPAGVADAAASDAATTIEAAIPLAADAPRPARASAGLWTWYYRWLFRRLGVSVGHGLIVRGPILLRLEGDPRLVRIGVNVTLMPGVDLKTRERGRLVLHDGVMLDSGVRLVAANDARVELGADVQVGLGTVINAGADVLVGRGASIAGYCSILASEHRYEGGAPIREQGYSHEPIHIGEGAWIATNVLVARGSRIGAGAVVSARSTVQGVIPAFAVAAGHPARVFRYRPR